MQEAACSSCPLGPPFVLCCPIDHEQLVLGSAQQWLPACQLLTSPDICDGCSGILALPYYKGSPFTVFLCEIWSCLVLRIELLGSVESPKFRSLFGPRLLLCEYRL